MFDEEYEKLTMIEKSRFQQMTNWLLAHTYLVQNTYEKDGSIGVVDMDYIFVERNFALFNSYFSFAGFKLEKDSNYGVISLSSEFEYNREHFDKLTTQILYILRLIYEEEREHISLIKESITEVGKIVHKMITLGVLKKKPADRDIHKSLALLEKFQVITKLEGKWESAETRMIILPTILFIVSNERISSIYSIVGDDNEEGEEEE